MSCNSGDVRSLGLTSTKIDGVYFDKNGYQAGSFRKVNGSNTYVLIEEPKENFSLEGSINSSCNRRTCNCNDPGCGCASLVGVT